MRSVLAGFEHPVVDAQTTFRAVLRALAEPGRAQLIDVVLPDGLAVDPASAAILLALTDIDTPCWAPPALREELSDYLRFHTGARFVDDPRDAAIAVVRAVEDLPALAGFAVGSSMSPETSTTVIVTVVDFDSGVEVVLDGPGFDRPRRVAPAGFDGDRWDEVAENHERFPAGVDLLLVCGSHVMGLPRSTRIVQPDLASTASVVA